MESGGILFPQANHAVTGEKGDGRRLLPSEVGDLWNLEGILALIGTPDHGFSSGFADTGGHPSWSEHWYPVVWNIEPEDCPIARHGDRGPSGLTALRQLSPFVSRWPATGHWLPLGVSYASSAHLSTSPSFPQMHLVIVSRR